MWCDLVWCGLGVVWCGVVWSGLVWPGLGWSGLVWSGLVWSECSAFQILFESGVWQTENTKGMERVREFSFIVYIFQFLFSRSEG